LQASDSAPACDARHCAIRPPPAGTSPQSRAWSAPQAERDHEQHFRKRFPPQYAHAREGRYASKPAWFSCPITKAVKRGSWICRDG
jgi:hypothetical protein